MTPDECKAWEDVVDLLEHGQTPSIRGWDEWGKAILAADAELIALRARVAVLEKALCAKDIEIAEATALVYSHEGAIHRMTGAHEESVRQVEALENRLAALDALKEE